jgi:NTE family protein
MTRAALALGSGGARGYAHIGAIQVLEEHGYEIVSVAGSSMGALVGGLHAAGRLGEYTEWVSGLSQLDVLRLLDLSLSAPGAIRADKIFSRVRELADGVLIEELPIPFTAIATDLLARREVWFQRGLLDVAVRASIAIPSVITPVMLNGRLLADGGLTNPVPIAPTTSARADVTIAVSLGGEHRSDAPDTPARETAEPRPVDEWLDRFRRGASQLLDSDMVRSLTRRFGGDAEDAAEPAGPFEDLPKDLGKWDVMNQSIEVMQHALTRHCLAAYPPDILIEIPRDACRSLDFHRANDMIALGRELTRASLSPDAPDSPSVRR